MPKIVQEGLKTYCVIASDVGEYFYTVEYRIIRDNRISVLLPVQIREKDNQSEVYYDVTGKRSLEDCAAEHAFSFSQCKNTIRELLRMMEEIEEYLLEPDFICFEPSYVYSNGSKLFWLYGISHNRSVQEELEDFLSFLLAKLDYDDQEAVHFVYQIFWIVRKQGFSGEVLKEYIEEFSLEKERREESNPDRYGEFFSQHPSELLSVNHREKNPETDRVHIEDEQNNRNMRGDLRSPEELSEEFPKSKRSFFPILRILLLAVLFTGFSLSSGILAFYGWEQGLTRTGILVLSACLLSALLTGLFLTLKLILFLSSRKGKEEDENLIEEDRIEIGNPGETEFAMPFVPFKESFSDSEEDLTSSPENDGTVILSKIKRNCPVLRSMEDGSLTLVRELPFYIGSDPVLNQMVLIDKTISRQHAVILQGKKNTWRIKDLGSTNGTWIRGVPVNSDLPDVLEEGVIISFAQKKYRFMVNHDSL